MGKNADEERENQEHVFGASPSHPDLMEKPKPQFGQGIYKDGNPKTQFGAVKPGLFYVPPIPLYEYGLAHMQGALKYGHFNWRDDPVSISTYVDACKRHIDLYQEGQKNASDTGIHNLAHAMCCLSIIMDAEAYGTLIDDRKRTILYTKDNTGEILEGYMEETKERVTKIKKEWTGHAEAVKNGTLDQWKKHKEHLEEEVVDAINPNIGRRCAVLSEKHAPLYGYITKQEQGPKGLIYTIYLDSGMSWKAEEQDVIFEV